MTEQLNPDGQMAEPFGGDGGDQIVNPANGCQTVGEYTDLTPSVTNNCGYTANTDGTPSAITNITPSDPLPRFIAPLAADSADPGTGWPAVSTCGPIRRPGRARRVRTGSSWPTAERVTRSRLSPASTT